MTDVEIRLATTAHDVTEASALYQDYLYRELGVPRNIRWHWDLLEPERTYLPGGETGSAMIVAVTPDGEVVGCAALRRNPPSALCPEWFTARHPRRDTALELARVGVRPRWRRQGLATRLVRAAQQHAATLDGSGVLHLHAHTTFPGAVEFWRSVGAQEVRPGAEADTRHDLADTCYFELPVQPEQDGPAARYRSWEEIQSRFVPGREEGFDLLMDMVEAVAGRPARVLDLGAGPGALSSRLAERFGCEVVAVELDPMLVTLGRQVHGETLRYLEADLRRPGWWDEVGGPVDAVTSSTALHYLEESDLPVLAQGIRAALRPGGVFADLDTITLDDPVLAEVVASRRDAGWRDAFPAGQQTWDEWWAALRELPGMAAAWTERERRFGARHPHAAPRLGALRASLLDAGLVAVDTVSQRLDKRLLIARG